MRKKILQEIHPLNLIREVQKWPVLYEKDSPERANMHLKNKMWLEVSKALFDDWETYPKPVKELKVQELTRKWRNLRDTFKRHVETEKKNREGQNIKRKTYVYFKYMLFLLPHISPSDEPPEEPPPELDEYFAKGRGRRPTKRRAASGATPPPCASAAAAPAAPPAATGHEEPIDEDKHFLLSLVPTFKRMTEDEKLAAKMEILRAIREVKNRCGERGPPLARSAAEGPIKMEFLSVDDAMQLHDSNESDHHSD